MSIASSCERDAVLRPLHAAIKTGRHKTADRRIVHMLDDVAMGGVTRALRNFEHPELCRWGRHETVDIHGAMVRATSPCDIAIVHFTANWRKLPLLLDLRMRGRFSRVILIEHSYTEGFESSEVGSPTRFRNMLKCAYGLVDQVVAVSQSQRRWILDAGLAHPNKVVAVPQSRDCSDLVGMTERERADGPLQIGAYGRFHRQKGFDLLLEAMAEVPASVAELKLAGTGPEEPKLREMANRLPHVEICAPFSSPVAFLAGVDLVSIPSRWEAFGLVGTEARAAARPILASRVDGLLDQLGDNGFSHACGSVTSIVRSIFQASAAQDLSARGRKARAEAIGEHDRMISGWSSLLARQAGASLA